MSQQIRGVLAPVVTPFKSDLPPDSQRFIAHCKWLLSQNCGLAVFGTNSEAKSLFSNCVVIGLVDVGSTQILQRQPGTICNRSRPA